MVRLVEQPPRAGADHAVRQHAMRLLEVLHGRVHRGVEHRLLAAVLERDVETLAEQSHLLMLDAELEQRAVGMMTHGCAGCRACRRGARSALREGLELRLVGLEAPQIGGGV